MSKFFTLCRTNNRKHGVKDQEINFTSKTNQKIKMKKINFYFACLMICLIATSVFFYLIQITSSATQGFDVSKRQNEIKELKLKNEELKKQLSQFESLDFLQEQSKELGMIKIDQSVIDYLEIKDSSLAMNLR
jgi:cell division protein FtsB